MDTAYLICAVVGSTLIVCQFLLTLVGLGGHDTVDHDIAHDIPHDGVGHEAGHGAESSWFFGVLTFKALSAACALFGLAGLGLRGALDEELPRLGVAALAGLTALFLVAKIMQTLTRLNIDGTVRVDRAVGARGTVYLPIPGNRSGAGKVQVSVLSRTLEYNAVTGEHSLPSGAPIIVVGVVNSDTVEVVSRHIVESHHE